MSLSKLPSEVLSSILNNRAMSFPHRLRLRLLSNRFCDVLEDGLKSETSLVIREKDAFTDYLKSKHEDLPIEEGTLSDGMISILVRLFPSLTALTLAFGKCNKTLTSWNTVPSLLAHLATTLTSVKLYGFIDESVAEPLASALAALPNLTLLGYYLTDHLLSHFEPVLSRLKSFAYPNYLKDSASILSSSLSPQCTHLMLNQDVFLSCSGHLLAQLSNNLTHLALIRCKGTIWSSLSSMHQLNSLALHFFLGDSSFFSNLASFTCLTEVKLYGLLYHSSLDLPSVMGTPLTTIKRLTMEVYFSSGASPDDYQAFFQTISDYFPALDHLRMINLQGRIPAIRDTLGKRSFSVEVVGSDDTWAEYM